MNDPTPTELIMSLDLQHSLGIQYDGDDSTSLYSQAARSLQAQLAETVRLQAVIDEAISALNRVDVSEYEFGSGSLSVVGNALTSAGFSSALEAVKADIWDEGVATALNHAIRNDDGVTLRLEHLDGAPWVNPYRSVETEGESRG